MGQHVQTGTNTTTIIATANNNNKYLYNYFL